MNKKIKSCPFCSSEDVETQTSYYHDGTGKVSPRYSVRCNGCGCKTKGFVQEKQAEKAWNRRGDAQ